jgi:hypothetical protein
MATFATTLAFVAPALLNTAQTTVLPNTKPSLALGAHSAKGALANGAVLKKPFTYLFAQTDFNSDVAQVVTPKNLLRSRTGLKMPPLNTMKLQHLDIGLNEIRVRMGNIDGLTEHQMLSGSQIGWCACDNAPTEMRLALIDDIVNQSIQNGCDHLEVTDVGAGRLLQTYLMTDQLLAADCKAITINLIDPFYPESICETYTKDKSFSPPQSSTLFNTHFDEDLQGVPTEVSEGFKVAAQEYLDYLKALRNDSFSGKDITVRILNSADLLPSLRAGARKPDQHQVVLTDPGEPALSKSNHFHMLGAGSKEALPHRDRVLIFFERTPLAETESKSDGPMQGSVYVKSDMYDEIAAKDTEFLKKLMALKRPTKAEIQVVFDQHYGADVHLYDDATQSFHQLLDSMPEARGIKLANREIVAGQTLREQQKLPLDDYFKQSGTMLGKNLSAGFRTVQFTYFEK